MAKYRVGCQSNDVTTLTYVCRHQMIRIPYTDTYRSTAFYTVSKPIVGQYWCKQNVHHTDSNHGGKCNTQPIHVQSYGLKICKFSKMLRIIYQDSANLHWISSFDLVQLAHSAQVLFCIFTVGSSLRGMVNMESISQLCPFCTTKGWQRLASTKLTMCIVQVCQWIFCSLLITTTTSHLLHSKTKNISCSFLNNNSYQMIVVS